MKFIKKLYKNSFFIKLLLIFKKLFKRNLVLSDNLKQKILIWDKSL